MMLKKVGGKKFWGMTNVAAMYAPAAASSTPVYTFIADGAPARR
jgi:hypothetical protein